MPTKVRLAAFLVYLNCVDDAEDIAVVNDGRNGKRKVADYLPSSELDQLRSPNSDSSPCLVVFLRPPARQPVVHNAEAMAKPIVAVHDVTATAWPVAEAGHMSMRPPPAWR